MKNDQATTRLSGDQLESLRTQGRPHSNLARVRAKTWAELEQDIAENPIFGFNRRIGMKRRKPSRLVPGGGFVTLMRRDRSPRINAVLRAFVAQQIERGG